MSAGRIGPGFSTGDWNTHSGYYWAKRRDIKVMCNLSQGIREDAQAEIIINMNRKGYTLEQIADVAEKSVEEIQAVIEKRISPSIVFFKC